MSEGREIVMTGTAQIRRAAIICMVLVQMMCVLSVRAEKPEQMAAVTITLDDNGENREGIAFDFYQVADAVNRNGGVTFRLTEAFAGSEVSLDVEHADEVNALMERLRGYIDASGISSAYRVKTDVKGYAKVSGLSPGMYLVVPDMKTSGDYGVIASSLVALPYPGEDGKWMFEETLIPKYTENPPKETETVPPLAPPVLGIEDYAHWTGIGLLIVGWMILTGAIVMLLAGRNTKEGR